jgi:hypothetical protein
MTSYPAGTRARVTFVGTIDEQGDFDLGNPVPTRDSPWIRKGCFEYAERVEVIEPDWQPGDIVLDAVGAVWENASPYRWLAPGDDIEHDSADLARPLTLLARDGKPVPPQVTE